MASGGGWRPAYGTAIVMSMQATIELDDALLGDARRVTGIEDTTALVTEALRALVAQALTHRIAALGRSDPRATVPPRRRSPTARGPNAP